MRVPGRSYIIINSAQAAIDLLDKRSHNYSDRPTLHIFEMCVFLFNFSQDCNSPSRMGWVPTLTMLPYGPQFQLHRRMFQQYFNRKECVSYRPIQTREACILLQNLASTPDERNEHLSRQVNH